MTVIAYDGLILAADQQGTRGRLIEKTTKLFRYNCGGKQCVLGTSGTQETGLLMIEWYKNGALPPKYPDCQQKDGWSNLIVVMRDKVMFYSRWPAPVLLEDKFMAWGSGQDFAVGAMAAGKNAIEAVEITCLYSDACGVGIDAYDLKTMEKIR